MINVFPPESVAITREHFDIGPVLRSHSAMVTSGQYQSIPTEISSARWILITPSLDAFEIQKAQFRQIPPLSLAPYSGKWVVSKDGAIVDSDDDLQRLSGRFFGMHGDVDVYIAKIGNQAAAFIRTPFLR